MPVCFGQFWEYIQNYEVKGQDGREQLIRENDYIDFTVKINPIDNQDVSPAQVRMVIAGGTRPFDTCAKDYLFDYFNCNLIYPSTSGKLWTQDRVDYQIIVLDTTGNQIPTDVIDSGVLGGKPVYVDSVGPVFDQFEIDEPIIDGMPVSSDGNVSITYRVRDRVCDASAAYCNNYCSGIWKVEFYLNNFGGSPILTDEINTDACSTGAAVRRASYSMPPGVVTGVFSICPKAYDRFDNQREGACQQFRVDKKAPSIKSLKILMGGMELKYYGNTPVEVTASALIEDEDFNPDLGVGTIYADLREICSECGGSDPPDECYTDTDENETQCNWIITMDVTTAGRKNMYVTATDKAGHEVTKKFSKTINYDGEGPVVSSIETSRRVGADSYISASLTIIKATINEGKSGIDREDITLKLGYYEGLDFKEFQTMYPQVLNPNTAEPKRPKNCTKSGTSTWLCYWDAYFEGVHYNGTAEAVITGTDRLDNPIADNEFNIIIDTVKPKIYVNNVPEPNVNLMDAGITYTPPRPTAADMIEFTFNATEEVTFSVRADSISDEHFPKSGTCTKITQRVWECSVPITDVKEEHKVGSVGFTITDLAGNNITIEKHDVEIYELAELVKPNVIVSVTPIGYTPQFIDKKAISQIDMYTMVDIEINKNPSVSGPVTILGKESADVKCDMTFLTGGFTLYEVPAGSSDFSDQGYSYKSLLGFYIAAYDFGADMHYLTVPCNISLRVEAEGKVYTEKEVESFDLVFPLTDLPLGYIEDSVSDMINDLKDDIEDKKEYIEDLEVWNDFFGVMCSIVNIIVSIDSLLQAITGLVNGILCAFDWTGGTAPGWWAFCTHVYNFHKWVMYYVYNSRNWNPTPQLIFKMMCFIYWGKFCDQDYWAALWGSLFDGVSKPKEGDKPATSVFSDPASPLITTTPAQTETDKPTTSITPYDNVDSAGLIMYEAAGGGWEQPPGPDSNWMFGDPFKSIESAKACIFLPGIIYNENKLKQIMCKKVLCYETAGAAGIPITSCDNMYTQEECLYYYSAEWYSGGETIFAFVDWEELINIFVFATLAAFFGTDATELVSAIIQALIEKKQLWQIIKPWDLISGIAGSYCYIKLKLGDDIPPVAVNADCSAVSSCEDVADTICYIEHSIEQLESIIDMFSSEKIDEYWYFNGALEGTDYCESVSFD